MELRRFAELTDFASSKAVNKISKEIRLADENPRLNGRSWVKNDAKVSSRKAAIQQVHGLDPKRRCEMHIQTDVRAGAGPVAFPDG